MVFVMIMTTSDDDDDIYDEVYVCHEKSSICIKARSVCSFYPLKWS